MELGKRPVEGITAQSDMWIVRLAERFRVLAMSKMFQSKRNGYVDLKGGGWGVEVHNAKQEPQHGDRVWIDLAYMGMEGHRRKSSSIRFLAKALTCEGTRNTSALFSRRSTSKNFWRRSRCRQGSHLFDGIVLAGVASPVQCGYTVIVVMSRLSRSGKSK